MFLETLFLVFALYLLILGALFFAEKVVTDGHTDGGVAHLFSKFKSLDIFRDLELQLKNSPSKADIRADLIQASFFVFPELRGSRSARENILWFIKNAPDRNAPWTEWGLHFVGDASDIAAGINLFKASLSIHSNNISILKNAADFSRHIDIYFSASCYEAVSEIQPFNKNVINRIASLKVSQAYFSKVNCRELNEQAFHLYQKYFKMPWGEDDGERACSAQMKYGKIVFNNFCTYSLLILITPARREFWSPDHWTLTEAIKSALETQNIPQAKKWAKKLKNLVDRISESNVGGIHFLLPSYATLARLALREKDYPLLRHYIRFLIKSPIESLAQFYQVDTDLFNDLHRAGEAILANDFVGKRLENSPVRDDIEMELRKD